MNWKAPGETSATVEGVAEPATRASARPAGEEGDWLCIWCHNRVANDGERFSYEDRDEFSFANPERIPFHIITFAAAPGCREEGVPTLEHTWFPGHAWSYSLCAECGQHLGWHFAGEFTFVGLIKDRIIRAGLLRN